MDFIALFISFSAWFWCGVGGVVEVGSFAEVNFFYNGHPACFSGRVESQSSEVLELVGGFRQCVVGLLQQGFGCFRLQVLGLLGVFRLFDCGRRGRARWRALVVSPSRPVSAWIVSSYSMGRLRKVLGR